MNLRLASAKGGPIRLGSQLGRGGEGAVFDLADRSDLVVKIYYSPPEPDKADKLLAMANGCTDRLRAIAAWPIETIHESAGGPVRGFVMKRVARQKDIHVLYGPKTRLRDYPDATYRFLVHVAANLARAFAVVHEYGHVIGDVNQGGVCVSAQGTVTLVDCDSFQVRSGQRVFGCDVGIPIYQPPELQNALSFHGLQRSPNHDAFGLAVLIFQTLFLARHPFAGAFQGDGDMPIERAIREFRFAYARDAARRQMRQPPGSLGLRAVPEAVAELFERAFLEDGASGRRPSAIEWVTALDGLLGELSDCAHNPGHAYARTLSKCPLCEIEGRVGVLLFLPPPPATVHSPTFDLEGLWRELVPIIASARPPSIAKLSLQVVSPPETILKFARAKFRATVALWVGIAASLLLTMFWRPAAFAGVMMSVALAVILRGRMPDESRNIGGRLKAAQERFDAVLHQLEREHSTSPLLGMETRADALYRGLRDFSRRREERLRSLERSRYDRQMRRFLDQFEVKDSGLKGFGSGLFAALVSHGVETADDITVQKLRGIAGFGPKRKSALLSWRKSLEVRFKFNPSDPADEQERSRFEQELQLERAREAAELRRLAEQIKVIAPPLGVKVSALTAEFEHAQRDLAIARAIAEALGKAA